MAGIYGISAYQQMNASWNADSKKAEDKKVRDQAVSENAKTGEGKSIGQVTVKKWNPIDTESSLVPHKSDYGMAIGDVKLSDQAKEYYEELKSKFGNHNFILVSKDMMEQVKQNAAAYGSSSGLVVLIDEEKIERMATDPSYRKKYEGIITMAQNRIEQALKQFGSSGVSVKNFGMSVDENGKESFFATVEKSQKLQKERIEAKREANKQARAKEEKKAREHRLEERIEERRAERKEAFDRLKDVPGEDIAEETAEPEYVYMEASSYDKLMNRLVSYAYDMAADQARTQEERSLGQNIDFKG